MTAEQAAPAMDRAPKPFFDEHVRINPMMSLKAFQAATPLFNHEVHGFAARDLMARGGKAERRKGLQWSFLYFLLLWVIALFAFRGAAILAGRVTSEELFVDILTAYGVVAGFNLLYTVLSSTVMEFFCLSMRIKRDQEWDLVCLSSLTRRGVAATVFGSIRLYHRRYWVSIFNTRLVVIYSALLMLGALIYLTLQYAGATVALAVQYIGDGHVVSVLVTILAGVCVTLVLLLEMRWRWGGMTALGTAFAFGLGNHFVSLPIRFGAWLGSFVVELALIGFSWGLSRGIVVWLDQLPTIYLFRARGLGIDATVFRILVAAILIGVLLYVYFRLMRFIGLRLAYYAVQHEVEAG